MVLFLDDVAIFLWIYIFSFNIIEDSWTDVHPLWKYTYKRVSFNDVDTV